MLARRTETRRTESHDVRAQGAEHASLRPHPAQVINGGEAQLQLVL